MAYKISTIFSWCQPKAGFKPLISGSVVLSSTTVLLLLSYLLIFNIFFSLPFYLDVIEWLDLNPGSQDL
jgi:hypothetical protein